MGAPPGIVPPWRMPSHTQYTRKQFIQTSEEQSASPETELEDQDILTFKQPQRVSALAQPQAVCVSVVQLESSSPLEDPAAAPEPVERKETVSTTSAADIEELKLQPKGSWLTHLGTFQYPIVMLTSTAVGGVAGALIAGPLGVAIGKSLLMLC